VENSEKKTGKYSTDEVTPLIRKNDNATQNPKLLPNSLPWE
jgi:hypothetical protein